MISGVDMRSFAFTLAGSSPSEMTFATRSRSVTMPTGCVSFVMMIEPVFASVISFPSLSAVSDTSAVISLRDITSLTARSVSNAWHASIKIQILLCRCYY